MATTDEILAAMADEPEAFDEGESHIFLIDAETREISIPESERLFGAWQDMDVERKYFQCPRIVGDNIDLSKHQIFVNYVPSKQDGTYDVKEKVGSYLCEDLQAEGDNITFSWRLSENVTREAGYIAFAVYAKTSDSEGNLKTKWHTTIAVGNVLDTLPDGSQIAEQYPDIIMQLLEKIERAEAGIPAVSEEDNGKFLQVVDGKWAAAELPVYEGEFIITPSAAEDQTLLTAQKLMNADITIKKIPYSEVTNPSNGITVTIGE